MNIENQIFCEKSEEILKSFPSQSVNLIVTSPPYADRRKSSYGGIHPDKYVEWFMPIANELYRVLKDDGSFILNIKENAVDGERHTYVLELIIAMRKAGWLWTEEYIWHKKNCFPGKWKNRFRDAWERCLHFTKSKNFQMFQDAVKIPIGDWAKSRLAKLSEKDKTRDNSSVNSGFGKKISNWVGKEMVYPTNVLNFATECSNKGHSAAFPLELPNWFIKLFSKENDVVLDPFCGSGTTLVSASKLNRKWVGIDYLQDNTDLCKKALNIKE